MKIIYAIPGLGTTAKLFKNIVVPDHQLKILEWPAPQPNTTMKEYAGELAKQIDTSAPVNLLGVSFGGMLCCELVDMLNVSRIALISSCKTKNELPFLFSILRKMPAHRFFTEKQYRGLASKARWIIGFEKADMPEYIQMVKDMPEHHFERCFNMMVRWDRKSNKAPILHIHGNADRLLGHSSIKNCETIAGGNHAMIIYKSGEINLLLNTYFNGL